LKVPVRLKENEFERDAAKALRRCLAEVPFVRIRELQAQPPRGPDILARLNLPGGNKALVAEVKSSGQPRITRQAVTQLATYVERFKNAYGVFIAPYVSDRSAVICEEAGVGFVDLAGNCRLCFDQVYVRKTGFENPYAEKRDLRSLYSPKATRVLRVWLSYPLRPWRVQELASEAGVSLGQASNVKKLLEDREWIKSDDKGFWLTEPQALLVEWAANQRYRRDRSWKCYTVESPPEFEARLAEACSRVALRYALTAFSAAARLAPMVRTARVSAYVLGDVQGLIKTLGLKRVETGANVSLIEPGDEGIFYGSRPFDSVVVVSAVQACLDVKRLGGRGDEAAEAILSEVLRKQW
jgi:hypothetical protein